MGTEVKTPYDPGSWTDEQRTFLTGDNALYVAQLYSRYIEKPSSVSPEWQSYFAMMDDNTLSILKDVTGPSWAPRKANGAETTKPTTVGEVTGSRQDILDSLRAVMLIRAYRVCGHMMADLNPLDAPKTTLIDELNPATYGFEEGDYDRPIFINYVLGMETATLRQILEILQKTYCGKIAFEFLHIQDAEKKLWIQKRIEGEGQDGIVTAAYDKSTKTEILKDLATAEEFEKFLHVKYPAAKRFGLDGGESLIPGLEKLLSRSAELGVKEVVLGMAHRGRLNIIANVMGMPYRSLFSQFQGGSANPDDVQGSGDVKYHIGTSSDRTFNGREVHLSLTANPSHLEAVDPVVVGKVRAKQFQRGDTERKEVMGLLLHGDAAFAGQGLVAETLCMSELVGYETGGTFHVIINNQIGFTTSPRYSRSTVHSSDLAKAIQCPIFHVSGDDPEAVAKIMILAAEYRHTFNSDVVVDLVCYRRYGHNEADEPAFTQPLMYKKIRSHAPIGEIYKGRLLGEGSLSQADIDTIQSGCLDRLKSEFDAAKDYKPSKADWLEGRWTGLKNQQAAEPQPITGASMKTLQAVGKALTTSFPAGFNLHPKLNRFIEGRAQMFKTGKGVDWSTAEALAFGTLACDGTMVRLSGQDCGRGTFTQRHAIFKDQQTAKRHNPLNFIEEGQAHFEVWDSPLSEASVLGFELGYSLAEPNALVLWEGQFGDFANGAQVIIDQFISSGETKWLRMSGLVMLLPHGYEGQGPEHSSARLERYLQMCAEDNMQVANCTTPANYFHILRRQTARSYRKPLILMTPKSLLRHKLVISSLEEMTGKTSFMPVIGETYTIAKDKDITRVVICSGKVYYDLLEKREEAGIKNIAIVRLEQYYPFPEAELVQELKRYTNAEVVWCQEEPRNMGAWHFLDRRLETVLNETKNKNTRPLYVGRLDAAATATGLMSRHVFEQNLLVSQALKLV